MVSDEILKFKTRKMFLCVTYSSLSSGNLCHSSSARLTSVCVQKGFMMIDGAPLEEEKQSREIGERQESRWSFEFCAL